MSRKTNRRHFLKSAALGVGSLGLSELVANKLFGQLTSSAFAQSLSMEPNPGGYYFHISLNGAPPRWFFDLPLTPNGNVSAANYTPGGFGNNFQKVGSTMNVVHRTFKLPGTNLHLPPVWGYKTSKDFTTLAQHCLFIRGMDAEIDNHPISNRRNTTPIFGGLTLNGAVADRSNRPLASIMDGGSGSGGSFKSKKGSSANLVNLNSANPITALLQSFTPLSPAAPHAAGQNLALQEEALSQIERHLAKAGYAENSITDNYEKAADLIEADIRKVALEYPAIYNKYLALVKEAFTPAKGSLPGLFDQPIPVTPTSTDFRINRLTTEPKLTLGDARDMLNPNVNVRGLAQSFAVMEVLADRLSTNFAMSIQNPTGFNIGGGLTGDITNDQHFIGRHVSTLVTTLYYRAILSCLTEFVDRLKAKGIFNNSVIHISGDFNRNPRTDGSGSDHGVKGSNATLISGKFGQARVIGNIKKDSSRGLGTWGESAVYFAADGLPIRINDVALTVSHLLDVGVVVANGYSLVKKTGNLWVPTNPVANNV